MMKNILFSFALVFMITPLVQAQDSTTDALSQAQAMMKDKSAREELFKKDSKARQTDEFASKAVGGDENSKEQLYDISSDIMTQLVRAGNQDPAKMQEILKKALENPEAFQRSLSPDIQARIHKIVRKIEDQRTVNSSKDKSLQSP